MQEQELLSGYQTDEQLEKEYSQHEIAMELYSRLRSKESLYEFSKQAWHVVAGETPFTDGWHIQAICEHLEAVHRREIRRLIINIPPRMSKTNLTCVFFPAWVWLHRAQTQFMCASYSFDLAVDASRLCRNLIRSDWYQHRYGDIYHILSGQDEARSYYNNRGGYRKTTGTLGSITGRGGNILIADDPNNAKAGESEAQRDAAIHWWSQVWSSRMNNAKEDCMIVVQQRLNEKDITGHILSGENASIWQKLILPMEFETSRRSKTIILPFTNGKIWQDPRTKEGELLCEERMGQKEVDELKFNLRDDYSRAGQLQQRPAPEAGGIIKKSWFRLYDKPHAPKIEYTMLSLDTALEAKEHNAYSAATVWGIFNDEFNVPNAILLNMWRGHVEYPDLRKQVKLMYEDYRNNGNMPEGFKPNVKFRPDCVLIEAKVSGISLVQDLIRAGIPALRFDPNKYGDKIQRVRTITHLLECGRVWLPTRPPDYKELRSYADLFRQQACTFPNAESRDLVDTMTQALIKLRDSGWLYHVDDGEYGEEGIKPDARKLY